MSNITIEPIAMLPFGMLNAFLIVQERRAILVDSGLPHSEGKVEKALRNHGLSWPDIKLVVLTHGHIDHAGSAVRIGELTKAPLLAHKDEINYCTGFAPVLRPTGIFGKLFQKTGLIQRPFDYFTPDIAMSGDELDLMDFRFSAQLLHTPGHTSGSISLIVDSVNVIAGDLVASGILLGGIALKGRPKQPPFEEAPSVVAKSLRRLLSCDCERFFLGHGGPLSPLGIRAHIEFLETAIH